MSQLDTLITVSITAASATPSVANFGTPAIYGYHTHNTDLIRTYIDAAGMLTDGFAATDPLYYMATSILAQNPRPSSFKVIRATTAAVHVFTFTVTDNNNGDKVGFTLLSPAGVSTDCHVTVSLQTTGQVATAIAAIVDPLAGVAAVAVGSVVTVTGGTAGQMWYVSNLFGGNYQDTTALAATHPNADLTAVRLVDDNWYALAIQNYDTNNIADVAAWVESNKKIFWAQTTDADVLANTEGNIADIVEDAAYARTGVDYTGTPGAYGPLGLAAQRLTADPGSDTWAYKTVAGRPADALTPTQTANIDAVNGNYYINVAGVNVSLFGRAGSGLFMDITRGVDALQADIQTRIYNLLIANPKVPYTAAGIAQVGSQVRAALKAAVATGFISNDSGFEPQVSLPAIADVSSADKAARLLKGIKFTCFAQGAVHKVQISGVVNL